MREYDDHYNDENIRLYTPVLQRIIVLATVIIAVPVIMWTITTFVRGYIARPKVPTLEHVASTNMPARIPAISSSPPSPAPSAADQSAPQRVDRASASDAASPENRNGLTKLASPPDASAAPAAANNPSGVFLRTAPTKTPSSVLATTATGDISTSTLPVRRRQNRPWHLDRMTIPLRPARRTPRTAASPGLIRTRTARRTSPRRGFRLLQRPHRRHARQL